GSGGCPTPRRWTGGPHPHPALSQREREICCLASGATEHVIPRYSNPEMARIWADEQKYEYWRRVEVAVCEAWAEQGVVPEDALPATRAARTDLTRIDEISAQTRHDVIAFVRSPADSARLRTNAITSWRVWAKISSM